MCEKMRETIYPLDNKLEKRNENWDIVHYKHVTRNVKLMTF